LRYAAGQAASAVVCASPAGTLDLTISWQTCAVACLTPVSSPLAAFSQMASIFDLTAAVRVGADATLALQAATASAMPGFVEAAGAAAAEVAAAVVAAALVAAALVAGAAAELLLLELLLLLLLELLLELLLPHPAISAAPTMATTNNRANLFTVSSPR
jgi:hypothetical protein